MPDKDGRAGTRDRMVDAAVAGLQRHGVANTSFSEVLEQSGAARGAIYHHFPGGKGELVAEAGARNGQAVEGALSTLPGDSPRAVVEAYMKALRPVMAVAADGGGCAVAAITVAGEPGLTEVARGAFDSWGSALAGRLRDVGLAHREATERAAAMIAVMEGGQILCRAAGSTVPFDRAARSLVLDAKGW